VKSIHTSQCNKKGGLPKSQAPLKGIKPPPQIFRRPRGKGDSEGGAIYGATAYAKESSQYGVQLPAIVKDGTFYNYKMKELRGEDGKLSFVRVGETPAEYIPTPAEQIAELKKRNEELEEVLDQLVLKSLGGE